MIGYQTEPEDMRRRSQEKEAMIGEKAGEGYRTEPENRKSPYTGTGYKTESENRKSSKFIKNGFSDIGEGENPEQVIEQNVIVSEQDLDEIEENVRNLQQQMDPKLALSAAKEEIKALNLGVDVNTLITEQLLQDYAKYIGDDKVGKKYYLMWIQENHPALSKNIIDIKNNSGQVQKILKDNNLTAYVVSKKKKKK